MLPDRRGNVLVWNEVPALLSVNEAIADKYRNWIREGLKMGGYHWKMCNYLSVRRDPYIVIASMQESDMGSVYTKEGLFVDLYEDKYRSWSGFGRTRAGKAAV